MVDFRYHLISLIAVFLALGLGILMGTVVLNDQLVDGLKRDIGDVREHNENLEKEIVDLDSRIAGANTFASEVSEWLTAGALEGRVVVLVELEGTDGDTVGDIEDSIVEAGGEVPTTIVVTDKFQLGSTVEREQLALAIDSTSATASDLRFEAGGVLGARLAAAAAEAPTAARPQDVAQERLGNLLRDLADLEYVTVDAPEDESIVPSNAMFMVLGGNNNERPYDATGLITSLVAELSSRGAPTLVAEPAESAWGLVTAIRDDPEAAARVATVDQADTVEGRIAVVLGLQRAFAGSTDHYGVGQGATQIIPDPAPVS